MATRTALAITLTAAVMLTQASCSQLECGEGTTEENGACVPADGERPTNNDCGTGTHYDDMEGGCVPDFPPTVCGNNTVPTTNVDGIIECEGTGGGCLALSCANPAPGTVSLCGRLYDVQTDLPIGEGLDGTRCESTGGTATDGACALNIRFFPALPFASNPTGTPPLPPAEFIMTNCGYFSAASIDEPELGYMGIGVDDLPASGNDDYTLAGVALPAAAGLRRDDLIVYGVSRATDTLWSDAAGVSPSFGTRGAYVPIFLYGEGAPFSTDPAEPVAGVVVTENGTNEPANTYYFEDTDPHTRAALGQVASGAGPDFTGANGSAVKVLSALVNHSGTGNEPGTNCQWPSDLAASIMGVTFVQRRVAETSTGVTCP